MEQQQFEPRNVAAWLESLYDALKSTARKDANKIKAKAEEGPEQFATAMGVPTPEILAGLELLLLEQRLERLKEVQRVLSPVPLNDAADCLQVIRRVFERKSIGAKQLADFRPFESIAISINASREAFDIAGNDLLRLAARLQQMNSNDARECPPPFLSITFGPHSIARDGHNSDSKRIKPRALEMLKALFDSGERGLTVDELCDSLRPKYESIDERGIWNCQSDINKAIVKLGLIVVAAKYYDDGHYRLVDVASIPDTARKNLLKKVGRK